MHDTPPPPRRKTYRARNAVLAVIAVAAIGTAAGGIDRTLSAGPAGAPAEIATFGPSPDPGFATAAAAAPQLGAPPPVPAPIATASRMKMPPAVRHPAVTVYRAGPRPAARKAPPPPARKHCRYGKRKEH